MKSLNNNLVLAFNDKKEEFVLFGKGIGFGVKKGDPINSDFIEKIFYANENNLLLQLEDLDPDVLSVSEKILRQVEGSLDKKLNSKALFSLADHLQGAIERSKKGIALEENTLQWEIPFLYFQEYNLGKKSLEIIKEDLGVELPESEAAFLALHFVSAQDGIESINETLLITSVTKSMVKTIQSLFDLSLDKESLSYSRFVIHIRHFMNRQLHRKVPVKEMADPSLFDIIRKQYPKSYACSLVLREMLKDEYDLTVSDEELLYLMIHIQQLVAENTKP